MTYDPIRGRTLMYVSGDWSTERTHYDVWEWNGTTWVLRNTLMSPPYFHEPSIVFHEGLSRAVMMGTPLGFWGGCCLDPGQSDVTETWLFGGTSLPSLSGFGVGCGGATGVPQIGAPIGSLPFLEGSLEIELSSLPDGAASFLLLGASNTTWGAVSLPFNLASIGMANCSFVVSPDIVVPLSTVGTGASLSAPVPADPSLLGEIVYLQGGVVDPTANPAGVALTAGLAATIGGR